MNNSRRIYDLVMGRLIEAYEPDDVFVYVVQENETISDRVIRRFITRM